MNNLAVQLEKTLTTASNRFSLTEKSSSLERAACLDKINHYRDWLDSMDIHSVMVLSPPSIDIVCLCYALVLSNKTYIPVHSSTSPQLLKTYLKKYQVDLLIIHPSLAPEMSLDLKNEELKNHNNDFFYCTPNNQPHTFCFMPGIIFFTSGTTEEPKAVYYEYATLAAYLSWCVEEFKLKKQDCILFTSELSFVASLRPLFVPLLSGARLCFLGTDTGNKLQLIMDALSAYKISVLNITPTLFKILIQHIKQGALQHTLSSIRLILLSGEPIDSNTINHWFAHLKADTIFYNLYGATEYLVPFYKKIMYHLNEEERLHLGQLRTGSDYRLVSNENQGFELYVAGDLSTAYFDNNLTRNNSLAFEDRRFIKTNDFVFMRDKKIFFSSRQERIIKRYGQLVNLDQIEYLLGKEHHTLEFIAFADTDKEDKIYLIIGGIKYNQTRLEEINATLQTYLPRYMHPSEYIFVEQLPLTASGKTDYFRLKQQILHTPAHNVLDYFKQFFPNQEVDKKAKILELGLQSIDYIEMTEAFLHWTGKWLDSSQIHNQTRIEDLESCLIPVSLSKSADLNKVKLNPAIHAAYSYELDLNQKEKACYLISSLLLKGTIDIHRLELAIKQTLDNHFILSSRLDYMEGAYFFVKTTPQEQFTLPAPLFFTKNTINQLKINAHSDRMVKIYIQKKGKQCFLFLSYHHIALDGWSAYLLREEIFQRYEGTHKIPLVQPEDEISYINQAHEISIYDNAALNQLQALMKYIEYEKYNQLSMLFNGEAQVKHTCFTISKNKIDDFKHRHAIEESPDSVIFALLFYKIIANVSQKNRIFFFTSLSNRNLPVPHIKKLIANMSTGALVFLDSTNQTTAELTQHIQKLFTLYFKNMSYAAMNEMRRREIIPRDFLSHHKRTYSLIYTYINQITGEESIQNKYIDWNQSINDININKKKVFLRVYNLGSQFVVTFYSKMNKGIHDDLVNQMNELL